MGGRGRIWRKFPFSSFNFGDDGFNCMTYVGPKRQSHNGRKLEQFFHRELVQFDNRRPLLRRGDERDAFDVEQHRRCAIASCYSPSNPTRNTPRKESVSRLILPNCAPQTPPVARPLPRFSTPRESYARSPETVSQVAVKRPPSWERDSRWTEFGGRWGDRVAMT